MEKFVEILTELSSVIGVPAVICLAWAAFVIRDHEKKIKTLEKRIKELEDALEKQADRRSDELSKVYNRLNALANDVAFIRGTLEQQGGRR